MKFHSRLFGLVLSLIAAAPALKSADNPAAALRPPLTSVAGKPAGISAAAWDSILRQVQRELYAAEPDKTGVLQAYNQGQRLDLSFAPGGPQVTPSGKKTALQFNLLGYGYGSALAAVAPVAPVAEKNRVEYRHGSIVEWYVNEPRGIEQGFTIARAPARGAAGAAEPLRLEIGVKTDLTAKAQSNGSLVFTDARGVKHYGFGSFTARDANGRTLPAKMEILPGENTGRDGAVRVALVVDDRSASYPLVLDPTLISLESEIGANYQLTIGSPSYLGTSVALSGDGSTLIVGIPYGNGGGAAGAGLAFIFTQSNGAWQLQAEVLGDKQAGYNFGTAVALDYNGKVALVGSENASVTVSGSPVASAGDAFILVLGSNGAWSHQAMLTPTLPAGTAGADAQDGANFGNSVALSADGTVALVGSFGYGGGSSNNQGPPPGAAYIFKNTSGTTWTAEQRLTDPSGQSSVFGLSVALSGASGSGEIALIGAPGENNLAGTAYAYVSNSTGTAWTVLGPSAFPVPTLSVGDNYGWGVAISSDGLTALIGAPGYISIGDNGIVNGTGPGTAYVLTNNSGTWSAPAPLPAPNSAAPNYGTFGVVVAISGVTGAGQVALVGDSYGDPFVTGGNNGSIPPPGPGAGSAYVYTFGSGTWTNQSKIVASDTALEDGFGLAVALDSAGVTAIVGAPFSSPNSVTQGGSAYVFTPGTTGAAWSSPVQKTEITGADENQSVQTGLSGGAGSSVAMASDTELVLGFPGAVNKGAPGTGEALVFTLSSGTWSEVAKLTASDASPNANFGSSVSISSSGTVVVGADNANIALGEAYVFTYNSATSSYGQQGAPLTASDGSVPSFFGGSTAISTDGLTVLVGAPDTKIGSMAGAGSAYIYTYNGTNWIQRFEMTASDAAASSSFGGAVGLSGTSGTGEVAIIGAASATSGPALDGEAYVFTSTNSGGTTWTQAQSPLVASDAEAHGNFGRAVAISGDAGTLLIGAPASASASTTGNAYVFTKNISGTYVQAAEQQDTNAGGWFGNSVALSSNGQVALIGSRALTPSGGIASGVSGAGGVYAFAPASGGAWSSGFAQQGPTFYAPDYLANAFLGTAVAISNDGLVGVAGAPENTVAGIADAGTAYVFSLVSVTVTSAASVPGIESHSFSYQATASGGSGTYTYSVTGTLPAGLTLNTATGVISGVPTATGNSTVTLTATDSNSNSGQISLTITVYPVDLTSKLNVTGINGVSFSDQLASAGGTGPYTYALGGSSGPLPAGLTLSTSGLISGTPTANGTYPVIIQVTDHNGLTGSATLTITVNTVGVTSAATALAIQYNFFSFQLTAAGGTSPYTYASNGGLPAGLSLNPSTGIVSGSPTALGGSKFLFTVTDHNGNSVQSSMTITVNAIGFTGSNGAVISSSSAKAIKGFNFSLMTNVNGGSQPYSYAVTSGSLPSGISVNQSTGQISGTPTVTGSFSATITVTDNSSPANTATLTLSITVATIGITSPTTASGIEGVAFSYNINANGGTSPYTYGVSGNFPSWLSVNTSNGQLTGTPNAIGTSSFTITVTDSATTPNTASQTLTLSVTNLGFTSSNNASGVANFPFSYQAVVTGGTPSYSYALTSGTLPTGLSLNTATGLISGTPSATGGANVTLTATDSAKPTPNTATLQLQININTMGITSPSSASGTTGTPFSYQIVVEGGTGTYTYAISSGSLPSGVTLNTSTGLISGTPSASGGSGFNITVTDNATPPDTAQANVLVSITNPLSINSSTSASGAVGVAFTYQTNVNGGFSPYTYSITGGALPGGLNLNSSTGAITGTPSASGTFNATLTATDSSTPTAETANLSLTITISGSLSITGASSAYGIAGSFFSYQPTTTGGNAPYQYLLTSGTLPSGLTMNSFGQISGNTSALGSFPITIQVTDNNGHTASVSTTIFINTIGIGGTASASGISGVAFSFALNSNGGTGPYTYALASGSLPAGLTLNGSSGVISGTTSVVGTSNVTITVTDSTQPTPNMATDPFSIVINVVGITNNTQNSIDGFLNTAFTYQLNGAGGTSPYTYALSPNSAALPAGLTLSSSGAITGTPTHTGFATVSVTITDHASNSSQASLNFDIATIGITSAQNATGYTGTPFTYQATVSGGTPSYTYALNGGNLPAGLTLNASTGQITGTPTATGFSSVMLQVTDSAANTAQINLGINIMNGVSISGASTANGVVATSFSYQASANGGVMPYTYSITSGSLAAGLTLNTSSGQITGTPTAVANGNITITVTDSASNTSSLVVGLMIAQGAPVITWPQPTAIADDTALSSTQLDATAANAAGTALTGTFVYSPVSGTVMSTPGLQTLSVTFTPDDTTDYTGATAQVSITVNVPGAPVFATQPTSQTATAYTTAMFTAAATGSPTPTYQWQVSTVPGGTSFTNLSDGNNISGSATATLSIANVTSASNGYLFQVVATSGGAGGSVSATSNAVSLTVTKATATVMLTSGSLTQTYSGSPLPAAATSTPSSLAIIFTYTGTSGTSYGPSTTAPTAAGTYTVNAMINDSNYQGSTTGTLTIGKAASSITQAPTAGTITYGQTLAASALSGGTGSVAGSFAFTTPATAPGAGTASQGVTFTPTNTADYTSATTTVSVTVNKATPTITTAPTATSITFGQTLAASALNSGVASTAGTFAFTTPTTAPGAGTASQPVTFTPTDATDYNPATTSVSVTVNKATSTITTAPTATAITFGQTLAASTLNGGVASTAGSFAFTSTVTAPGAGTASQGVTFTPTDATDYTTATTSVSVTVNKATPTITTAPTATAITYGQTLASSTLSGGVASVAGSFAFTTPSTAPGAGTAAQGVTFTPADSTDYNAVTTTVNVTVNQATPTITTAPTATAITFGQTLAASTLNSGVASTAGTFAFTTPATAPGAGTAAQGVTFTPADTIDYTTATTTVSVTVNKAATTITTAPTATVITFGQTLASSTLSGGVGSVAGSFAFTTSSTAPGAGTAAQGVTFTPADATDYTTATTTVSVTVNKAATTITTAPTAAAIAFGQTLASATLSGGVGSVAGSFAFTTPSTAPATGTASQGVTFTPTDTTDYTTATTTVSVTVNKATPTITTAPTATAIIFGQTLASSTLSGGVGSVAGSFAFTTPSTAPGAGTASQGVTFTPTDTTDYTTVTTTASVTVNKATTTITTAPTATAITYGQTLAASTLSGGVASTAGTFAFSAPATAPGAGTAAQGVTFTPADTADYTTATTTVSVTVNQATPTITTAPTATAITYGQTLAASTLNSGVASTAGTFAFTTPSTGPGAGTAAQGVTFTPADAIDYTTVTTTVSVTVNKAVTTITTAPTAAAITYGQTLAASALSGGVGSVAGSFAFTTPATAPAAGTPSEGVTFTPTDATDYATATTTVSVTVNQATATVTLTTASLTQVYTGSPLAAVATTSPSGLTVNLTYSSLSYGPSATAPTNVGTYTVNAVVSDPNYQGSASGTLTIVLVAPTITSNLSEGATFGTAFSYAITATELPTSYSASGLPGGLTVNTSTGAISGAPTAAGTFNVTLGATNGTGTGTAALVITVAPGFSVPVISSSSQAAGQVGVAFSYTILANNSPTGFSASGLPAGLTLSATTGAISGQPTAPGTYSVTLTASNAVGTGPAFALTITIASTVNAPSITSAATAAGTVGTAFSYSITTSVAATSYAATGLPAGLTLNTATGVISGTPTAVGTTTVTVTAANAAGTGSPLILTITIQPGAQAPAITSSITAAGTQGQAFAYTITATNTPTSFTATGLPAGLTLTTATGAISGTPTSVGSSSVVLTASNASGASSPVILTITINAAPTAPAITSGNTAGATIGVAFSYQIVANPAATSYALVGGPAWLGINTATGLLSGTPTGSPGTFTVILSATNAAGTSEPLALAITVDAAAGTPVVTSTTSPAAVTAGAATTDTVAGSLYQILVLPSTQIQYYYVNGSLPAGLSLDPVLGLIFGTPTLPGTYAVSVGAANAVGIGAATTITLTINAAPGTPTISNSGGSSASALAHGEATEDGGPSTTGTVGAAFSYQIQATGSPTSYAASNLPAGLAVNTYTGVITGIPTTAGTFTALISASNGIGTGASTDLIITISPPATAPAISSSPTGSATAGTAYTYQMAASNSPTSFNASGLPAGLTLNASTGAISGTPTAPGVYTVSLSANNASGTGSVLALTLTVASTAGAPAITSVSTASGTVAAAFTTYQVTASNGPITSYTAINLPAGLAINPVTGAITGTPTTAGTYTATLTATNAAGPSAPFALVITVAPAATSASVTSAATAGATINAAFSYQITASNSPTSFNVTGLPSGLTVNTTTGLITGTVTTAGSYPVTISVNNATGTGATFALTISIINPASYARLTNLSARAYVGAGSSVLIAGFEVGGSGAKDLLVRGVGPGMGTTFTSITDALPNAKLTLFDGETVPEIITSQNGWANTPTAGSSPVPVVTSVTTATIMNSLGAFPLVANSLDSAFMATVPVGGYSAQISGVGSAGGIALAELYDADTGNVPSARLTNISARAPVGTGFNVLIAGFAVAGNTSETVLIRGVGPALSNTFGLAGTLVNPFVQLFDGNGVLIAANTGWNIAPTTGPSPVVTIVAPATASLMLSVGAFALLPNSGDTAMVVTLPPGHYTAELSGINGTVGIGMVEIYEVP